MKNEFNGFNLQLFNAGAGLSWTKIGSSFVLDSNKISGYAAGLNGTSGATGAGASSTLNLTSTASYLLSYSGTTLINLNGGSSGTGYKLQLGETFAGVSISSTVNLAYSATDKTIYLVKPTNTATATRLTELTDFGESTVGVTFSTLGTLSVINDKLEIKGSSGAVVSGGERGHFFVQNGQSITALVESTFSDSDGNANYTINNLNIVSTNANEGKKNTTVSADGKTITVFGDYSITDISSPGVIKITANANDSATIVTSAAGDSFNLDSMTITALGENDTITYANSTSANGGADLWSFTTDTTVAADSASYYKGKTFSIAQGATVEIDGVKYKATSSNIKQNTVKFDSTSGTVETGSGIDIADDDATPSDDGGSNDGGSNDGGSNDGGSDDGGSNDGGSNDGGSNDGGSNDGGSDDGGSNDGGSDDGASDDGASDDGASSETEDDDTEDAENYLDDVAGEPTVTADETGSHDLGNSAFASVPAGAKGTIDLNMTGTGAAYVAIASGTGAKVNVDLGASNGSFISNGGKNTAIEFGDSTDAKVALGENSKATFTGYNWKNGGGIATSAGATDLSDFYGILKNKLLSLLSAFKLDNAEDVTKDILADAVSGTDTNDADAGSAYVNLYYGDQFSEKVTMGLTGSGDSYIDTNANEDGLADKDVILVGNYSGNKGGTASLTSGSGNDAIYAGDNDTVDAGNGKNYIYLSYEEVSTNGTTVIMSTGSNIVENMGGNDVIVTEALVQSVEAQVNGDVIFTNEDGGATTVVGGGNGKDSFNVKAAGVDYTAIAGRNSVTYDGSANYYNASGQSASITASTSTAEIWLNKEVAAQYGYGADINGDIKYINASNVSGRSTLAGSAEIDNVITASKGASSLWGGGASNDTLIGGSGADTFFYMKGDGDDSIRGASASDTVRLEGGLTLSDITKIDVGSASVALEFSDGGSLTLNSNSGTKFKIDGATYTYDKSAGEWKQS